jgi:hypothetical protein
MRKLILIGAISLIATQVYAGGSRSLSLAATNATEQAAAPATTQPAPPPQATVTATTTTPATTPVATPPAPQATPPAATSTEPARTKAASRPTHRKLSDEARLIRELHRHGIYW